MMKHVRIAALTVTVAIAAVFVIAADPPAPDPAPKTELVPDLKWTEDIQAAQAQAQKEGKDLLVDFTGSDWCGWCIRLDKEVFSQDAFKKAIPAQFVLVKLDFPRNRKLPPATRAQNNQWKNKLGVRGFPTIFLLDARGRAFAQTGYRRGGPEPYVAHLQELRKIRIRRDEHFAAAEKAEGVEKAKHLDKGLSELKFQYITSSYRDVVEQIVKLDAKNEAKLREKYEPVLVQMEVQEALAKNDPAAALKKIDEILAKETTGQKAQDLLVVKAQVLFKQGKRDLSRKALHDAIKAAPEGKSVPSIKRILKNVFKEG